PPTYKAAPHLPHRAIPLRRYFTSPPPRYFGRVGSSYRAAHVSNVCSSRSGCHVPSATTLPRCVRFPAQDGFVGIRLTDGAVHSPPLGRRTPRSLRWATMLYVLSPET